MDSSFNQSKVIKVSGYYNLLMAHLIPIPALQSLFGLELPFVAAALIGILLMYTAAMLIIGSQDLLRYRRVILFEALLRFGGAILFIGAFTFSDKYSVLMLLAGIVDATWGLAYCAIVPSAAQQSVSEIIRGGGAAKC